MGNDKNLKTIRKVPVVFGMKANAFLHLKQSTASLHLIQKQTACDLMVNKARTHIGVKLLGKTISIENLLFVHAAIVSGGILNCFLFLASVNAS